MHISKTLAALVAASSLGGGALALVAPGVADAAVPAGADVAGVVTVGGAPAANVEVDLYDANSAATPSDYIGTAYTDASGQYWFDIDGDDASDGIPDANDSRLGSIDNDATTATQFKAAFSDDRASARGQLRWHYEYTGDQPTLARATPVNRVLGGLTAVPTADLAVDSGAQGTVTVPVPAGYTYSGTVFAIGEDETNLGYGADYQADFNGDPADDATDPFDGQTSWEMRSLEPGQSYRFLFTATATPIDPNSTADNIFYVGSFYGNSSTLADAKVVDTTPGQFATGIDGSLTNALTAEEKPSIKGQVAPGKTVKADPGTWTLRGGTTYSYQWVLNGTLVSTTDSYKIPKKHSVKKKLQLVVTAQNFNNAGSVALPATKIKYASKLKAKAKAVYVNGKRVVQIKGHLKVQGVKKKKLAKALKGVKVTVYEVSKTDDTVMVKVGKAKVKKGDLLVTVKGLISGKHYLEIDLTGKKVAEVLKTVKAKV